MAQGLASPSQALDRRSELFSAAKNWQSEAILEQAKGGPLSLPDSKSGDGRKEAHPAIVALVGAKDGKHRPHSDLVKTLRVLHQSGFKQKPVRVSNGGFRRSLYDYAAIDPGPHKLQAIEESAVYSGDTKRFDDRSAAKDTLHPFVRAFAHGKKSTADLLSLLKESLERSYSGSEGVDKDIKRNIIQRALLEGMINGHGSNVEALIKEIVSNKAFYLEQLFLFGREENVVDGLIEDTMSLYQNYLETIIDKHGEKLNTEEPEFVYDPKPAIVNILTNDYLVEQMGQVRFASIVTELIKNGLYSCLKEVYDHWSQDRGLVSGCLRQISKEAKPVNDTEHDAKTSLVGALVDNLLEGGDEEAFAGLDDNQARARLAAIDDFLDTAMMKDTELCSSIIEGMGSVDLNYSRLVAKACQRGKNSVLYAMLENKNIPRDVFADLSLAEIIARQGEGWQGLTGLLLVNFRRVNLAKQNLSQLEAAFKAACGKSAAHNWALRILEEIEKKWPEHELQETLSTAMATLIKGSCESQDSRYLAEVLISRGAVPKMDDFRTDAELAIFQGSPILGLYRDAGVDDLWSIMS